MKYVDGYVLPVPKKSLEAYRRMASEAAKVWRKHGALEFRECVGDDLKTIKVKSFPSAVKPKRGRDGGFLVDRVQVSRASRQRKRQSDGRSADSKDDEDEKDAVRLKAHGLWRLQGHG
jgi:uncharacterized protein YbaA (DUF1428 family)